eukprot:gene9065-biopygen8558
MPKNLCQHGFLEEKLRRAELNRELIAKERQHKLGQGSAPRFMMPLRRGGAPLWSEHCTGHSQVRMRKSMQEEMTLCTDTSTAVGAPRPGALDE